MKIEPRKIKIKKIIDKPVLSTELFDKFNKEIFEGDIIHFDFDSHLKTSIFYKDGSFCFHSENQSILQINQEFAKHMIVIGSIFENPEILN
jgi:hypothetical protein